MGNSPYARLKLTRNPFGELAVEERAELALVDLDGLGQWLEQPRSALQILGPSGHGKTTHLFALKKRLPHCPYVYFPDTGEQPLCPPQRPLLVDEAQRVQWWRRRQLLRGPGPLVIATHVDWTVRLQRAGFCVHTIDVGLPQSPEKLQQMLNRRILASAYLPSQEIACSKADPADADHHPLCLTRAQVVDLQQRCGSNIRLIEHYLYDIFQRLAEKGQLCLPVKL